MTSYTQPSSPQIQIPSKWKKYGSLNSNLLSYSSIVFFLVEGSACSRGKR